MPPIRGYIAATVDGYIAGPNEEIDWLDAFTGDYGYGSFIAEIDTVVMGRKSYDFVISMGEWHYLGKRAIIVTHRPLGNAPEGVEAFSGNVAELVRRLRGEEGRDIWVVGGSQVQQQFLDAGGLDRIEVFVMPVLLGDGIPLWPRSEQRRRLTLRSATAMELGVVRLDYSIGADA